MNFMKRIHYALIILFVFLASACKSVKPLGSEGEGKTPPAQEQKTQDFKNTLKKFPGAMLWQIDGFSQTGEPSKVYLLGTYHAGDDRMYPIPECVQSAIDSSDRFVCELSKEDWDKMPQLMNDITMKSFLLDLSHTFVDDLYQEEILLISTFIDQQTLAQLICFEPWVLNNYLQQVLIMASGLNTQQAYDVFIMDQIAKRNLTFEGLDKAETQLNLVAYGDWETQLIMLRDTLKDLQNLELSAQEMEDLYKVFLAGDEEAFGEAYYKDLKNDLLSHPVYKEYIKALLDDRNQDWATKIADYIKQGGTTFVFAGCAHFTGPASVFEYMRKNGDL